jgi:hypothetical protein
MFKKGFAHSTVNCYISGLSFKNKLHNFEDNTDAFIVRKMLDGIKRCSLNKSDSRLPITRELLGKILSVLPAICKSSFESCLFLDEIEVKHLKLELDTIVYHLVAPSELLLLSHIDPFLIFTRKFQDRHHNFLR